MTSTGSGKTTQVSHSAGHGSGKIGPNSIIQTVRALQDFYGQKKAVEILEQGGQGHVLTRELNEMIDEQDFIALAKMLYSQLGVDDTLPLLRRSGNLTGEYVLANRIPKPVQRLIKFLPLPLRLKVLLTAIGKSSWTFAGSGTYSFITRPRPLITINNSIIKQAVQAKKPVCSYYTGAFETLIKTLVSPRAVIEEVECLAGGSDKCRFVVKL
jgi:divinyl protochlorophyllide a 8-vinyl-reductase